MVLTAVRALELGLENDATVARTRLSTLIAMLPEESADKSMAARYVHALDLVQGETSGFSPEEREARAHQFRKLWTTDGTMPAARRALDSFVATDLVAQYLAIAIDCEDGAARKRLVPSEILSRHPVPLIKFRLALCTGPSSAFEELRAGNERWNETYFFEGRREMTRFPFPNVRRAAEAFARAQRAFPASAAVTLSLAASRNALGEYAAALELFDTVLARTPKHGDALLGRLLSLSHLSRHVEAVKTATALVDLGRHHRGEALYWRAWNRYQLHHLPDAWRDIREASALVDSSPVHTLAGYIAYARQWPETAITRLRRAFELDQTNCDAPWTEGLVHVDKEEWSVAASRFAVAVECFTSADEELTRRLAAPEFSMGSPADTSQRNQRESERLKHRRAQAAYNTAWAYARAGEPAKALPFCEVAAQHSLLKEKAISLRTTLQKQP